jgi:double-stranded uracil-DNA glycosylase
LLSDLLTQDLIVVFTGTSVATASASRGHYYAGSGNKFYEFLWEAGLTGERRLIPEQDSMLLQFRLGITDLVKGLAASSDSLLTSGDFDVPAFVGKIETHTPFVVAFNGKEAARRVARHFGSGDPSLGPAPWKVGSSLAYVLPSSSGASANPRDFAPKSSKVEWWREFGAWLAKQIRRSEQRYNNGMQRTDGWPSASRRR